jgi:hypothetical protein
VGSAGESDQVEDGIGVGSVEDGGGGGVTPGVSTIGWALSLEPERESAAGLVMAARRVILPAPRERGPVDDRLGFLGRGRGAGREEEKNGDMGRGRGD